MKAEYRVINDQALVYQANTLVGASYALSENEQKLLLIAISLLKRTDDTFRTVFLDTRDIAEIFKFRSKNRLRKVRDLAADLKRKELTIRENGMNYTITWFDKCGVSDDKKYIELRFHDDLMPYLLQLQLRGCYTISELRILLALEGRYPIRLYQMVRQYKTTGKWTVTIEELHFRLCIDSGSAYQDFSLFRSKILDPSLNAINRHSNLRVLCMPEQEGRRVVKLKFKIKPSSKTRRHIEKEEERFSRLEQGAEDIRSFRSWKKEIVKKRLEEVGDATRNKLEGRFRSELSKNRIIYQMYLKHGLQSKGVKVLHDEFLERELLSEEERDFEIWRQEKTTTTP